MEIIWTDFAKERVLNLLLFIRKCWGDTIAATAWGNIQKDIALLENFPEIGQVYLANKPLDIVIRELVVNKKNKIYYYIRNDKVYIVMAWDTRTNPKTLKRLLLHFFQINNY